MVRGGTVLDGAGAAASRADVGVSGGRIAAAGRLGGGPCGYVIDATGRYVAAGFVDTHSHV